MSSTVGPANVSGCLGSGGALTGAREGKSLSRQAATPLKPGGSVTFGMGSRDSGDDVESSFSCTVCLLSSTLQCWPLLPPTLWLWQCCLNLPRVRGVCLAEIKA